MSEWLSHILTWCSTKFYTWGFKRLAYWMIKKAYLKTGISEIYRVTSEAALAELYRNDEIAIAQNRDAILTEYAEYLFTEIRNHDQLTPQTLAFESKFNEILPKTYPAAMMYFEAHKAAKREDTTVVLLNEIKQMIAVQSVQDQTILRFMQHDIDLFKEFDNRFPESKINYSLLKVSTVTKFTDYDLTVWSEIEYWLTQISNAFIDKEVQHRGQELLKAFKEFRLFTMVNYFTDHNNWCTEDDSIVSPEEFIRIRESRIYKWEPDGWDPETYNQREPIILNGLQKHVPAIENAYREFRLEVKQKLGV